MSVLVPAKFPSLSAVFMAAAASLLLLFVTRVLYLLMRLWSCPMDRPESEEKASSLHSFTFASNPWGRSLQWNILPFTLAPPEKPSVEGGDGVDMVFSLKRSRTLPVVIWEPRTGPRFQPPPPALYESPVPLSMAKMIMSRHTFRKPNPNRTRKSSAASSGPTSPPQTPSRLYHSIA